VDAQKRMQAKTGEILAVFPQGGFTIIRTFGPAHEEFYGHYQCFVGIRDEREIQKGLTVNFQTSGLKTGKRAKALLIEIERAESIQGAA